MAIFLTVVSHDNPTPGCPLLYFNGVWAEQPLAENEWRRATRNHPRATYELTSSLEGVEVCANISEFDPDRRLIVEQELERIALVALDNMTRVQSDVSYQYDVSDWPMLRLGDAINEPIPIPEAPATAPSPQAPSPQFSFNVIYGPKGESKDQWHVHGECASIEEAKALLEAVKPSLAAGHTAAIKKVDATAQLDTNWRDRESDRFDSGRYKRTPWYEMGYTHHYDHFAHIAESDSKKIAYTESEEKGQRDIQKVISAEAYLEKFFTDISWTSSNGKPYMPADHQAECLAELTGVGATVLFTGLGNADEMERVYNKCHESRDYDTQSCMSYRTDRFQSFMHPVRVYALGGELELAYITDDNGYVMARTLVWPERKTWARVYGTKALRLTKALKALGYSEGNGISGAKFARVPNDAEMFKAGLLESGDGQYVVPYIDGSQTFGDSPCGKFFVIDGDYCGDSQSGVYELGNGYAMCERCEGSYDPDESYTVDGQSWCESCYSDHRFCCDSCDESYALDDSVTVYRPDRWESNGMGTRYVCLGCYNNCGYTHVEGLDYPVADSLTAGCDDCEESFLATDINDDDRCATCATTHDDEAVEAEANERIEA